MFRDYLNVVFCPKGSGTPTCLLSGMDAPPGEINYSVPGLKVLEGAETLILYMYPYKWVTACSIQEESYISGVIGLPLESYQK